MRRILVLLALAACGGTDEQAGPSYDAEPMWDSTKVDLDAGPYEGVLCGDGTVSCEEVCCDDTCVGAADTCAGRRIVCDGPEDCPSAQECCLFDDRSECTDDGVCGTTGAISNRMCHVAEDCLPGEECCGTGPGPATDVYGICLSGGCPQ